MVLKNQKGGGVGFLIRNDITNITEEHEPNSINNSEHKWITIKGRTNIAICVMYFQESVNTNEAEQQFQELTTQINLLQKTHTE